MTVSTSSAWRLLADERERGSMYMYIWVVKRFGTLVGVTHRVKGMRPSAGGCQS